MSLKYQWSVMKSKEILKYLETSDNKNTTTQNLWVAVKAVLRGKFTVIQAFLLKIRKISNKKPNLALTRIRKRRTNKT